MRHLPLFALLATVFAAGTAAAQGTPATHSAYVKLGDFEIIQVATADNDAFEKAWNADGHLPTTLATVRNTPITVHLIYAGCKANAKGNCDVTADFEVLKPDGTRYGLQKDYEVSHEAAAGKASYQMGKDYLALTIEKGEPLGAYRVIVTTTDHVSGATIRTEQTLAVSEAK